MILGADCIEKCTHFLTKFCKKTIISRGPLSEPHGTPGVRGPQFGKHCVMRCFLRALQDLRPNCGHRRRSVDELAATLHFSHHLCRSSNDVNLRLVTAMQSSVFSGYVHFVVLTNVKLKVISLKILNFRLKLTQPM